VRAERRAVLGSIAHVYKQFLRMKIPKAKKDSDDCPLTLEGFARVKATRKTLMKSTPEMVRTNLCVIGNEKGGCPILGVEMSWK